MGVETRKLTVQRLLESNSDAAKRLYHLLENFEKINEVDIIEIQMEIRFKKKEDGS